MGRNANRWRVPTIWATSLVTALAPLAGVAPADASPGAAKRSTQLYVALGDSYATGYQAASRGNGSETRNGYTYQLPVLAKAKGCDLRLVDFSCTGAALESSVMDKGCSDLGPLVQRVRAAGGPTTPIIGTTCPDVALYGFILPLPIAEHLARLSVLDLPGRDQPGTHGRVPLRERSARRRDQATGAYGSLDATTKLAP